MVAGAALEAHARGSAAPRARVRRHAGRFALTTSGVLLLSLIVFPAVSPAAPAAASGCGTNWTSRSTPPKTIRVYLTDRHRVVVKNFRSYVPKVMASGEFPSSLPMAVLEAGATAVKQYAWYYALKGNHRAGYRTSSGICYDVRNDTSDQLYRPAAHASAKQRRAVDATWGLTLRKGKRFFLTGYRAGSSTHCGADADGWRLYSRSAANCARLGWSRQRIQAYYYAPRINFVWGGSGTHPTAKDTQPPDVVVPKVAPARRQPLSGNVTVRVRWRAHDESGIRSYALQQQVGEGRWKGVPLSKSRQTAIKLTTHPGHAYRFRVRVKDRAGNHSEWIAGPRFAPQVVQSDSASLHGDWHRSTDKGALGGSISSTKVAGTSAHLRFRGSSIGVVASRGPKFGKVRVLVDGAVVKTIDLWARKEKDRRVVFMHAWHTTGTHAITVEALGTTGRPQVELDAFVLLR
jgi:hypothetical protein